MMNMACHKFASNVVEKALIHADSETRAMLIDELLTPCGQGDPIRLMMQDQYASAYILLTNLHAIDWIALQTMSLNAC